MEKSAVVHLTKTDSLSVPSMVEIGSVILKKILKFCQCIFAFELDSPFLKVSCAKFGWRRRQQTTTDKIRLKVRWTKKKEKKSSTNYTEKHTHLLQNISGLAYHQKFINSLIDNTAFYMYYAQCVSLPKHITTSYVMCSYMYALYSGIIIYQNFSFTNEHFHYFHHFFIRRISMLMSP